MIRKPASVVPVRTVAPHVQAAIGRAAQPKVAERAPSLNRPATASPVPRPLPGIQARQPAPPDPRHLQAPRSQAAPPVQPKHPSPPIIQRAQAPHVQAATLGQVGTSPSAPAIRPTPNVISPRIAPGPSSSTVQAKGVIQCASVTASADGVTVTGHSGNGPTVGRLLTSANSADARKFRRILQAVTRMKGTKKKGGSAFSCAEPHAVAQLLKAGKSLDQITLAFASDQRGGMDTCPYCTEWIFNNKIVDDILIRRQPAAAAVATVAPAQTVPDVSSLTEFPKLSSSART